MREDQGTVNSVKAKATPTLRTTLHGAFENPQTRSFFYVQSFLSVLTLVSTFSIVVESVQSLAEYDRVFCLIEWICVIFFSMEFAGRLYVSASPRKYILSFWGMVDIATILPTILGLGNFTFLKTSRVLRILRLLRIVRIGKISRLYVQSRSLETYNREIDQINFAIYFLALLTTTLFFGALLYTTESEQPEYSNIPLACLQAAKMLLDGLNSVTPKTIMGELSSILCRLAGLALFGLLINVIGTTLNHWLFGDREKVKSD